MFGKLFCSRLIEEKTAQAFRRRCNFLQQHPNVFLSYLSTSEQLVRPGIKLICAWTCILTYLLTTYYTIPTCSMSKLDTEYYNSRVISFGQLGKVILGHRCPRVPIVCESKSQSGLGRGRNLFQNFKTNNDPLNLAYL